MTASTPPPAIDLDGDRLIDRYVNWLKWGSKAERTDGRMLQLSVPLLGRHNDHLRVYVGREHGSGLLLITDDGETIRDLKHVDVDFAPGSAFRDAALSILRGLGLAEAIVDTGVICAEATDDRFPQELHAVLQAMLAIDGLGI